MQLKTRSVDFEDLKAIAFERLPRYVPNNKLKASKRTQRRPVAATHQRSTEKHTSESERYNSVMVGAGACPTRADHPSHGGASAWDGAWYTAHHKGTHMAAHTVSSLLTATRIAAPQGAQHKRPIHTPHTPTRTRTLPPTLTVCIPSNGEHIQATSTRKRAAAHMLWSVLCGS